MSSFQNYGLPIVLTNIVNLIKQYGEDFQRFSTQPYDLEILSISLKTFYNCMTFNYNLSFYDYEPDSGISESTSILVNLNIWIDL